MPGRVNIFENTNTPCHEHDQHIFKSGIACWLERLGISTENEIYSSHTLPLPPSASLVSAEQRGKAKGMRQILAQ
jgi:hypothetical protein